MDDWEDPEMAEQMMEELEEKEEQLRLAAEFGQTLLERTEELQEENEAMEREKEALQAAFQEHEYRLAELADNSERLAEEAAAKDEELEASKQALAAARAEMEERMSAVTGSKAEQEAAVAEMQEAMEKQQAEAAAALAALQTEAAAIKEKEAETQAAREAENQERIEAQKSKKAMEKQLEQVGEEMARQRAQMAEAQARMAAEAEAAAKAAEEAERKNRDLADMQNKLQEMERQLQLANEAAASGAAATGQVNPLDLDVGGGMSLFDDLPSPAAAPAAAAGISEGVPPGTGMSPKSIDAIKEQAERDAKQEATAKAQQELEVEKAKMRAEYAAKLEAAEAAATKAAAEAAEAAAAAAEAGSEPPPAPAAEVVDKEALRAEMEAKYQAEALKQQAAAQTEYRAKMEAEIDAMRAKAEAEMKVQLERERRVKEYEMRAKSLSKALGVDGKVDKHAVAAIKQINTEIIVAADALREAKKQLVDDDEIAQAKADLAKAGTGKKVMGKAQGKGNRRASVKVDASAAVSVGASLASGILDKLGQMEDSEQEALKSHLNTLKEGASGAVESDEAVSAELAKRKQSAMAKQDVAALASEAQTIAKGVKSKEDILQAFQENEEFVGSVKKVVCEHIHSLVVGAEIPPVDVSKDWGTYALHNLKIVTLELDPEKLAMEVKESIRVKVKDLNAEFEQFNFQLNKHTFPKIEDEGVGVAKMAGFSITMDFDITSEEGTGKVGIEPSPPEIDLKTMEISVADCKHEWIFNKLLKWFEKSVKTKTVDEIKVQAAAKVEEFGDKLVHLVNTIL